MFINLTGSRFVLGLLLAHGLLLASSALVESPTCDETAHLPAGISHWISGTYHLYRVNPPCVRMVAALPVLAFDHGVDIHGTLDRDISYRYEFVFGRQFFERVGSVGFWWMTLARWICIPFSLVGGYICYRWAKALYGRDAGLFALALWCFSPSVLAYGHLITPDVAAAALGVTAGYCFWKWLQEPSWINVVWTGMALGIAELAKSTWIVLFGVWPVIWFLWRLAGASKIMCFPDAMASPGSNGSTSDIRCERDRERLNRLVQRRCLVLDAVQLMLILLIALDILNLGYGYEGSFEELGRFHFSSQLLSGHAGKSQFSVGNRFEGTWLANLPVPLPADYVLGIDLQRRDFEGTQPSYLRGKWRDGGWWYYYLYSLAIKEPVGTWLLLFLSMLLGLCVKKYAVSWWDELILLAPAVVVMVLVSSQTGLNHHVRYVLPCLPFLFIAMSKVARSIDFKHWWIAAISGGALVWSIGSSLYYFPHSLSYFNELAGGPQGGHFYLGNSNADWGQDLLYLKQWYVAHAEARPLHLAYDMELIDPKIAGIDWESVPSGPILNRPGTPVTRNWPWPACAAAIGKDEQNETGVEHVVSPPTVGPLPGWFVVSVNQIHRREGDLEYFLEFDPVAQIGYTMNVYHITLEDANRVRRKLGLSELKILIGF
jgi:4-amino-4-deoxy-L-arabinose transferase-like glycosyltransferase